MLIYVCVSSHDYGHAARQAAVLIQLHRRHPDWHLVISSSVDALFLPDRSFTSKTFSETTVVELTE